MMSVAAMLFMVAPPARRHFALYASSQHARPAKLAQVIADRRPPQQQRKFGGLLANPVVYDAARIFSACLPWCLALPLRAPPANVCHLAKLREPGGRM